MDPITAVLGIGSTLINKFFPDKEAADAARLKLLEMQQNGELKAMAQEHDLVMAQIAVNTEEAKSGSVFVSGARPFIMWVCGFALLYAAIMDPLMRFVAQVGFDYTGSFPAIDTTITFQLLAGMLGLGTMRTAEKFKGVASK